MNEQQKMIPIVSDEVVSTTASQAKRQLMTFFTNHTTELLGIIRSYVLRMGLAQGQAVPDVALEVLQEVAVEAMEHRDRFRPDGQPMAWLLGIALNVIKRKKVTAAKLYQREVTFGRLALLLQTPEPYNENELVDMIAPFSLPDPDGDLEANEQAGLILSLVSREDQHVLRLSILYDFERNALARELGITPVAARVRLHRALNRLRFAWNELQQKQSQLGLVDVAEEEPFMNKQLETRLQRRITMLYRYTSAMEYGDTDLLAAIVDEAQQDPILERMILEMNEVYQIADRTVVHPDDTIAAQEMLQATFANLHIGTVEPEEQFSVLHTHTDVAAETTSHPEPILASSTSKPGVPAPKFVQHRWYRSRTRWLLSAVAAVLILVLLLPGTGALANQFLSLFRVQQFQPVQTVERPDQLVRNMALILRNFGTVQWDKDMGTSVVTHVSGTHLSDVEKSLSFHPQLPTLLPDGVGQVPQFSVTSDLTATFVFNQATAQDYLKRTGQSDIVIPASLANAQFSIKLPPGFAAVYYDHCDGSAQDGKQNCSSGKVSLAIGEIPSPQITADGKASLSDLRAFLLSLPRLDSDLRNLVAHTDVNSGVIPVPVPSGASGQQVSLQGVQGLSLSYAKANLIVWQKQGLVYLVTTDGSDSAQLLKSAQSFH